MTPVLFDIRIHLNPRKRYLELHRTTDPRGNYLGTVTSTRAPGIAGVYSEAEKEIVTPDMVSVRASIPARWLKAWDRAGGFWWRKDMPRGSATLYTARGELIGTIYATVKE
jgi:hypothetical protein